MPKVKRHKESGLAAKIKANQKPGTDDIQIGNGLSTGEKIQVASMVSAAAIVSTLSFLLQGFIPFGMLTAVIAEPGIGKSAFVLFGLVRSVVTGCDWFNGMSGPPPGYVLWCGTENDVAITLDRMKKWAIPLDRILLPFADDPLKSIDLENPEHLELIETIINDHQIMLVVIDSLRGAQGGDENNSRIGKITAMVAGIAERTGAAIVVVHHTRKLAVDEEITANSSRGSNAIQATCRSQIGIDRPDPNSKRCRVRVLKENLGLAPTPVGFEVTNSGLVFGPAPARLQKTSAKSQAADWLLSRMKPGKSYLASAILAEAIECGHSERTIRKAATELLGVKPKQKRDGGHVIGWLWRLP